MDDTGGGQDPFGLDRLDVDQLVARPGMKWHRPAGRLAAWVADMDFPVAPAIRERLSRLVEDDLGYPDWPELDRSPLPERFAERMVARYGWAPNPERLHELADVMQGVRAAVHHLTRPGDGIVVHTPAYPPFFGSIDGLGRRVVDVPAEFVDGRWSFDHDALDRRLLDDPARLMILCHPHNPTGRVFARHELERVAEVAERHELVVVSDEIHAELVHPPHEHIPFASLAPEVAARTITVTSSSKAFNLAGLRWAILHAGVDRFHNALAALPGHYLGAPNALAVAATEAAWTDGAAWLDAVRQRLDRNRRRLAALLAEHLPDVGYIVPEATYLAWLDFRRAGFGDDPAEALRERGVELSPGPRFGMPGRGFSRLNFATSEALLVRIVEAMAGGAPVRTASSPSAARE